MRSERHDESAVRERLRHVLWIGGGSGAGKSTVCRRLAARHGLRRYATDDVMPEHARRSTPEDSPYLSDFLAMDMDAAHLVKPLLAVPRRAVWLLPTPEFRRAAFDSRGSLWQIARRTGDPERALRNLLERDRMFTERLSGEAKRLGLPVIEVGTTMTEDDLDERVTEAFGL